MSVQPYVPDPEHDVFLNSYDNEIPLACNVIYYVESQENEPLNAAMRKLAEQDNALLDDAKIQPYPFSLQYVAQSDLDEEVLRTALIPEYGEALAEETVGNFRRCFSDGQGGTLVARCLPTFSSGDFFEDDNTVCTFPGFRLTASRISESNVLFPPTIIFNYEGITIKTPALLHHNTDFISYDAVSSVMIHTPLAGISTITFHAYGREMKWLVDGR